MRRNNENDFFWILANFILNEIVNRIVTRRLGRTSLHSVELVLNSFQMCCSSCALTMPGVVLVQIFFLLLARLTHASVFLRI